MKNYLATIAGKRQISLQKTIEEITLPYRVFLVLRNLFKNGHLEVVTKFQLNDQTHVFRTLIQPDADIINIIPDMATIENNNKTLAIVNENHQVHQEKLKQIFDILEQNKSIGEKAFDLLLLFANAIPIYYTATDASNQNLIMTGSFIGVSFLFRKFLKPKVAKQLMKLFFKSIKGAIKFF